jgi:MFS family permease
MKAVLSSYTLSPAVFIPISGWMAARFGTRLVCASPNRFHMKSPKMIQGIHEAFFVQGGLTILSTVVFSRIEKYRR